MKANIHVIVALDKAALREISEADWQRAVVDHAERRGWTVWYVYTTAVKGRNGKFHGIGPPGWLDLTFSRRDDMFAAEMKDERGTLTKDQRLWMARWMAAGHDSYCWKPRDAQRVIDRLK